MSDGSLSQDEIDALLQGVDDMAPAGGATAPAAGDAGAAGPLVAGQGNPGDTALGVDEGVGRHRHVGHYVSRPAEPVVGERAINSPIIV